MRSREIFYLFVLGIGGVMGLYCILKAAKATEISSTVPYRYTELIFSIVIGYIFFKEVINIFTIIGASLIIPSALLIAYYDMAINSEHKPKKNIKTIQNIEVYSN